jgi:outer membrane immunogenic protein
MRSFAMRNFEPDIRETIADACNRSTSPFLAASRRWAGRVAAISTLFVSATAFAADMVMPTKAVPAPVYQWSGCYVGLNVGGGATGSNFSTGVDAGSYLVGTDPATVANDGSGSHGEDGLLAGGQAGCNLQSGLLVFGVEGDFDYYHSNPFFENPTDTLAAGTPFNVKQSLSTDYLATIRPRIGVAADRNLAYLTAGAAFTRASYAETYLDQAAPPGFGTATGSKSLVGWVAGAGWEYAFVDHWTFKAEYLYASFAKVEALGVIVEPGVGVNALHGSGDLTIQMLRAGVNYRF